MKYLIVSATHRDASGRRGLIVWHHVQDFGPRGHASRAKCGAYITHDYVDDIDVRDIVDATCNTCNS